MAANTDCPVCGHETQVAGVCKRCGKLWQCRCGMWLSKNIDHTCAYTKLQDVQLLFKKQQEEEERCFTKDGEWKGVHPPHSIAKGLEADRLLSEVMKEIKFK